MSNFKRIEFLHKHRILYRRMPISDVPTESYDWGFYYENGTHECFELFNSEAKISTYKSLKWHLLVIRYLNKDISLDLFNRVSKFISDKRNGFVTFDVSDIAMHHMIKDVMEMDVDRPPSNKLRKVIFKPFCGLSRSEKMSIVGKIMGRTTKVTQKSIFSAMDVIHCRGDKITLGSIAKELSCSTKSVQRNVNDDFNGRKREMNNAIKKPRRK